MLERKKQKLIDAYMNDAIPVEDLKPRQAQIAKEAAQASQVLDAAQIDARRLRQFVDQALALLGHMGEAYAIASDDERRLLNAAVFSALHVDVDEGDTSADNVPNVTSGDWNELMAAVTAYTPDSAPKLPQAPAPTPAPIRATAARTGARKARQATTSRQPGQQAKPPVTLSRAGGSNVHRLAEDRGFEPLRAVNPTRVPGERHRPLGESSNDGRS